MSLLFKSTIKPIEFSCHLHTTPSRIFRLLVSQNELRKWWAQRVVFSRNTVQQEIGRIIYMKLLEANENEVVRYSWLPADSGPNETESLISFNIKDLNVARNKNSDGEEPEEGVLLEVCHDNWLNEKERNKQEEIWKMALNTLQDLCKNYPKTPLPWWENRKSENEYIQLRLLEIKAFLEEMSENIFKSKPPTSYRNYKHFSRALFKACSQIDHLGEWLLSMQRDKLEFRIKGVILFTFALEGGSMEFTWKDLEKIIKRTQLADLAERLSIEQEHKVKQVRNINHEDTNISMPVLNLKIEMWVRWCKDLSIYTF